MQGLLMMHAYLSLAKICANQNGLEGIGARLINIGFVNRHLMSVHGNYARLSQLKFDWEVYIGVLSLVFVFIGGQSILGVLLYWQMLRVRYITSYGC